MSRLRLFLPFLVLVAFLGVTPSLGQVTDRQLNGLPLLSAMTTLVNPSLKHPEAFADVFIPKTMRVDYFHTGTKGTETLSLDAVYEEGQWSGSKLNLIDTLNLGEYQVAVYDTALTMLLFTRGFSTMFAEWQTTDEALSGTYRTIHETVRIPYPRQSVKVVISRRDKQLRFQEIWSTVIDPNSPVQVHHEKHSSDFHVEKFIDNGDPATKVDLVLVGDGYAKKDIAKFHRDVKHFTDVFFSVSPYKERKKDFNVWVIDVVSDESGIDKPDKNIWKNNALGTMYNTFGSARYILTTENRKLRDILSAVSYDFISIFVNDNRYGGGGIYNLYNTCYMQTDKKGMEWQMDYVYVHEFGHSFGGLGDEYYTSQVSYNDMYPKGIEPWEPNITALTDPEHIKWASLMEQGTPVPTPWEKSSYDSLAGIARKFDRLAPDYYQKREPIWRAEKNILETTKYAGKVGAFEGAGYADKGLFRPAADCRMFSLSLVGFDPVCSAALSRVIDFYSK